MALRESQPSDVRPLKRDSLPFVGTSFVGRSVPSSALQGSIRRSFLTTLVGAPGIGKTRLAVEVARGSPSHVIFCDLEGAGGDLLSVLRRVAQAAALDLAGGSTLSDLASLLEHFPEHLWLFDGCEGSLEAVAGVVAQLHRVPSQTVVVTSRTPLLVPGERVITLGPLTGPEACSRAHAMELWVDRVREVRPGYEPSTSNQVAIEILDRLEGVPLAIELVAARMAIMSDRAVRKRLDSILTLARNPRPGATPKETGLRASIEESFALLEPIEESALAQLAVFAGGFTASAAERVVDLSDQGDPPPMLDVLESLRRMSLVRTSTATGDLRMSLFGSIAELGRERLVRGGLLGEALLRHRTYYLAYGERAVGDAERSGEALDSLDAERSNLLAAAWHAFEGGALPHTDRIAKVLQRLHDMRGPVVGFEGLLDEIIANGGDGLAAALLMRGTNHYSGGSLGRAREDLTRAESLLGPVPDVRSRAEVARVLGLVALIDGSLDEAAQRFRDALEGFEAEGDVDGKGMALIGMATVARRKGCFQPALAGYRRALDALRASGNRHREAEALGNLGVLQADLGQSALAAHSCGRAEALYREFGNRSFAATVMGMGAVIRADVGAPAEALGIYERAQRETEFTGDRWATAILDGFAALAHIDLGEGAVARRLLIRACSVFEELASGSYHAVHLAYLAALDATEDLLEAAERRLRSANGILGALGANPADRALLVVLRGHLELGRARALAGRDRSEAAALILGVQGILDHARSGGVDSLAATNARMRSAVRRLESDLRRSWPAGWLEVDAGGRWFALPAGPTVDLAARPLLGRLLLALARHRLDAPGLVLSPEEFIAIGWPGERMQPKAAMNRLRVNLARLRSEGLGTVLESIGGGYRLAPDVVVGLVEAGVGGSGRLSGTSERCGQVEEFGAFGAAEPEEVAGTVERHTLAGQ